MRNALAAAAVLLLSAACGAYQFPGGSTSPTPQSAHLGGTVRSVPCAPVERAGSTCAGRPVAGVEIDYLVGNSVAGHAVTDPNGVYAIDLRPGTYAVKLTTYMRLISGPSRLTLGPGTRTVADYMLDNGMRVPVPQQ